MSTGTENSTGANPQNAGINEALLKRGCAALAKPSREWTVGALEAALLERFPSVDAEEWDRTGLQVGERALPVGKIALALDPTVAAIEEACSRGANVLITHHPPYLSAPDTFAPEASVALCSGAGVWAAIKNQVALMCFHTTLDVCEPAAQVLPGMLGLSFTGKVVSPSCAEGMRGYGQLSRVRAEDAPLSLAAFAARCLSVFGRVPRVWGDPDRVLKSVVTATGSAGPVGRDALKAGADCLVCGEIKYHEALDLSQAGLCVVELGHDVSELPLVAVLAQALVGLGFAEDRIVLIDQGSNWWTPDAIRI